MKRVMLVRHAEPEIDIEVPAAEWPLTPRGTERTKQLAARLAALGPTLIVASPERKALETGRLLAGILDLPWSRTTAFPSRARNQASSCPITPSFARSSVTTSIIPTRS